MAQLLLVLSDLEAWDDPFQNVALGTRNGSIKQMYLLHCRSYECCSRSCGKRMTSAKSLEAGHCRAKLPNCLSHRFAGWRHRAKSEFHFGDVKVHATRITW